MKALCWHHKGDVRVDTVPDPEIVDPTDAIVRITATAICGSDLHIYDGCTPTMEEGDILGHEPMGEVVAVGSAVTSSSSAIASSSSSPSPAGHAGSPPRLLLPVRHLEPEREVGRQD